MNFKKIPEFEKEFSKLERKYSSLPEDLEDLEEILGTSPVGIGKNFTIIYSCENIKVVIVKLHCETLRDRTIRLFYAYHDNRIEFVYIEIYYKGNKENHEYERVNEYLKNLW